MPVVEAEELTGLEQSVYRDSFEDFVKEFWECVPGAGTLVWNWHLSLYCRELQFIADRVKKGLPRVHDLIVNVPFGTSKSTVFSILFHPWVWVEMPHARFLYATHTDSLALDLAGKAKDVITSDKYRVYFPHISIRRDKGAKDDYANTLGGERKSCTVGGKTPTGRHAHFIGIDDPIDPQGARSAAVLETANKFVTEVVPSRMVDKEVTPTFLVQQRIDPRDPTRVMLDIAKKEGAVPVRRICLPGELCDGIAEVFPPLEELRRDFEGAYEDGLLDTKRLSRLVLSMYRTKLGQFAYSGQVLQNPVPRGGGQFKLQYFNRRARAAPREAIRVRYIDRAATAGGGCATAMTLMAKAPDGTLYVEHCEHGHWEPNERNDRIVAVAKQDRLRYGPRYEPTIVIEAERGSTGLESYQRIAARLAGHRVKEDRPTGSKDSRAEPWADQCAAGNVVICDNDGNPNWDVEAYIQEHLLFRPEPGARLGSFKDRVDSSSGACNWLANITPIAEVRVLRFRSGDKVKHPRVIVCPRHLLCSIEADIRAVLIQIADPFIETVPITAEDVPLTNLQEQMLVQFADIIPANYQETWDQPIAPYDRPAAELVMTREHGKQLWRFLTKNRTPPPELYVLVEESGNRSDAIAKAITDVLRIPRSAIHYADPDNSEGKEKEKPHNEHVYDVMKAARGAVM